MSAERKDQEILQGLLADDDIIGLKGLCKDNTGLGVGSQDIEVDEKSLAQMIAARKGCDILWWSDESDAAD